MSDNAQPRISDRASQPAERNTASLYGVCVSTKMETSARFDATPWNSLTAGTTLPAYSSANENGIRAGRSVSMLIPASLVRPRAINLSSRYTS